MSLLPFGCVLNSYGPSITEHMSHNPHKLGTKSNIIGVRHRLRSRKGARHRAEPGGYAEMDYEKVFRQKNVDLIFEKKAERGNFIAAANDEFTEFMGPEEFGREWAWSFPAGRYVIVVYQRHSLYESGKLVWKNEDFLNAVGKDSRYRSPAFVIILDRALEYRPKTWKWNLLSHTVQSSGDPLQAKMFSSAEDAGKAAAKYSEQGFRAAVMEWFEDYDMY